MDKLAPCLWFDGTAEAAARFYVTLLPDSRIDGVDRATIESPGGKPGDAMLVHFTLAGRSYQGLNGGPGFPFTQAISMSVATEDQAETDRLWDALSADGGAPVACGWVTDRFGLSWQIVPRRMLDMLASDDRAAAKRAMAAMTAMVKLDHEELERAFAGD